MYTVLTEPQRILYQTRIASNSSVSLPILPPEKRIIIPCIRRRLYILCWGYRDTRANVPHLSIVTYTQDVQNISHY